MHTHDPGVTIPDPAAGGPAGTRPVGRRSLLKAAGLGAGLAVTRAGTAGAAGRAGPTAANAPRAATAQLPLVGGVDFPIGIFWPPPPLQTTAARYQEIADAGFTFVISGNYVFDQYIGRYALGLADQAGLQMLIADDPRVQAACHTFKIADGGSAPLTISTADARTLIQQAINDYTPYGSFAGFDLFDEPDPSYFDSLTQAVSIVRDIDPTLLPYINLYPSNDPNYPAQFAATVNPSLVSYDRYPLGTAGDDASYFVNFANVRAVALAHDIPAWIYIQTLAYNGHRSPTAAEILWQINMSLAYGFSGVQYFTYWTPDPARGEGFEPALITVDGKRTERYAESTQINTRWLAPVGRELKPLVSETVVHANDTPLPAGATAFAPDDYIRAVDGGAVVLGRLRSRTAADTRRWLVVANRSHDSVTTVRLTLDAAHVGTTDLFVPAQRAYRPQRDPDHIPLTLDPGAAALLRLGAG